MTDESAPESLKSSERSPQPRRRMFVLPLVLAAAVLVVAAFRTQSGSKLREQAEAALRASDYRSAFSLAKQSLDRDPEHPQALLIAARAAYHLQDFADADRMLASLESLPRIDSDRVQISAGELCILRGRLRSAERFFRRVADRTESTHSESALKQLAWLLRIQGRNWELREPAFELMQRGHFSRDLLFPLAVPDRIWLDPREYEFLKSFGNSANRDPTVLLGPAIHDCQTRTSDFSLDVFRSIVADSPDVLEAQVQLASSLLNRGDHRAFVDWHVRLPEGADRFPEIWYLRGLWLQSQQQHEPAAGCFREAVRGDPNHLGACHQIARHLISTGRTADAERFAIRAENLRQLQQELTSNLENLADFSPELMRSIARRLETLGRRWEAVGWVEAAIGQYGLTPELASHRDRLHALLDDQRRLTSPEFNPAASVELKLPAWNGEFPLESVSADALLDRPREPARRIQFIDRAESARLTFRYENGSDPANGNVFMYHFSGGGAGVLDFDRDGWPDLYLTQGGDSIETTDREPPIDRMFRNRSGIRFQDVTEQTGIREAAYSQGVTAGDFNSDGFADLYIANIGHNALYRNNGDGTFTDVTERAGLFGESWTISCLMADLNGDALPELYDVNYLGGDALTRRCDRNGVPIQCPVDVFPGQKDRLSLNRSNGQFEDVSRTSGIALEEGKGMGIVAGDFDGSGRLSLFVANDATSNDLFLNRTPQTGAIPQFEERGLVRGVACGQDGSMQSCMGVAAGDADGDGRPDLMVTNFTLEPNNLYVMQPGEIYFTDSADRFHLQSPTRQWMGWGAQFIDGDLDGFEDAIVANGHLDRLTARATPYRMPAQFFRNSGGSRFSELRGATIGAYFAEPHVGRAVVRLDWNRDGRDDVCITHEDAPVALLTNATPDRGHFLAVRCVGTASNRDAIGVKLQLTSSTRTWQKQLFAGDGFQASNERRMSFGLGSDSGPVSLNVQWPSGNRQTFRDVAIDREISIVEGDSRIFPHEAARNKEP